MAGRPRTRVARKAGITCGAKTRKGTPCQRKLLLKGGKCLNHGGMSTGPKTPEGKARALLNLLLARTRKKKNDSESTGS
jgi:hypothetical protein